MRNELYPNDFTLEGTTVTSIAGGLDQIPTPGYFLQVFGPETEDGEAHLLINLDTRPGMASTRCSRGDLLDTLSTLRTELTLANNDHIAHQLEAWERAIAMDLPF